MTYFAVFCSFIVALQAFADALSPHPITVVLSFDGYRREFVEWPEAYYVRRFIHSNAAPTYLIPAFPTKTHVNHFTLATGLHPEVHGVINDCVFDRDGQFSEYTYEQYHHNDKDQVVPLWIENENQGDGRRSAIMMWPGAEFPFQGKKATYNEDYSEYYFRTRNRKFMDYQERAKKIFEWIEDEKEPVNLVMAYFGELNESLRFNGSQTQTTKEQISQIDFFIRDFVIQIEDKNLRSKINLIIIGGHGRDDVNYDGIIKLSDYLDNKNFNYITMGANALLDPNPGDFKDVYDNLKKRGTESKSFDVYKQEEMPDGWHLKHSPLLNGKIFLVAHRHHCFWGNHELTAFKEKQNSKDDFQVGADGYDLTNYFMESIFFGIGPGFQPGCSVKPFHMVDIHPLLKHLLDLTSPASDVQPNTQMTPMVMQMLLL